MATVTESDLNYVGSLGVDEDLMDLAGLVPYEKILVSNVNNGERFETYVIPAQRGSGRICLNGAAARMGLKGDRVIIFSFALLSEDEVGKFKPTVVVLSDNKPVKGPS
ncbi:MAG: aspartate 1-decarboxylase [Candidatus Magnetoovum sp. WYHC-5]|nr:aspartate 1-decarboxylase [Candidatus Magnetoovum sp. WYHC-5]